MVNYEKIYRLTLRETDSEPEYNVKFKNDKGETVIEKNISRIEINKRLDYDVTEFTLYYYRPAVMHGIQYGYTGEAQKYLKLEYIIFIDVGTGVEYRYKDIERLNE